MKQSLYEYIYVPGGSFEMGSSRVEVDACLREWKNHLVDARYTPQIFLGWIEKEYPCHRREVAPFRIGKYPVTNGLYKRIFSDAAMTPESIKLGLPDDHPVWGVSYEYASAFADRLSIIVGEKWLIPAEAEWEYAARGPTRREYPYGDQFDAGKCNTMESKIGVSTPVNSYPEGVSYWGVWDMGGNVEEWVSDYYTPYPGGRWISDDLTDALGDRYHILRGGSFARGGDLARCARRHGPFPSPEFRYTGFRLVAAA